MKKTLALLLSLAMSGTLLVSCGKENSQSEKNEADSAVSENVTDGNNSELNDDTSKFGDYSEGSESGSDDPQTEKTMYQKLISEIIESGCVTDIWEQDGDSGYRTTDMESFYEEKTSGGRVSYSICNSDGLFLLDPEGKRYYHLDSKNYSEYGAKWIEEMRELSEKYVSTTTEIIEGEEYTVEKYMDPDDDIMSLAFNENGELCFTKYDDYDEEYCAVIYTATADTSKFSLDGYTEITYDEYMDWATGYND